MHRFDQDLYLGVTPAGAYHAAAAQEPTPMRRLLLKLLKERSTPRVGDVPWTDWLGEAPPEPAVELIARMETLGWLWGLEAPEQCPSDSLEPLLPQLLPSLSSLRQALLADHHGLQIGYAGFDEAQVQGLAAVSADAVALAFRCRRLLGGLERAGPGAWGMIDAAGHSQIGVWPLFLGTEWFALILGGRPRFNHPDFLRLVWRLSLMVDGTPDPAPSFRKTKQSEE
ncbi:hypothetical protein [uncultured Thiodictyon sp.]|uniref:hypothetical protein n=1 Tax=uncultured Thiodictyon sp. TaxID=1846217 RepID=UPI0025CBFEAD|nr:hypothetical protein [uncultured Thiodictyon sp.]